MITVKLRGGLGNQMFQNAYGMALEKRGYQVTYDRTALGTGHREYSLAKFGAFGATPSGDTGPILSENGLQFNIDNLRPPDPAVMVGYWQTEKYFEDIKDAVRKRFGTHDSFEGPALDYWNKIRWSFDSSVALHVRRGDYVGADEAYHGLMSLNYYTEALAVIVAEYPNAKVFVFSDDREWCLEHFKEPRCTVVQGTDKYEDLWLMAFCKHAIIANSSFSWWGAWLGDWRDSRIVVAPKQWFTEQRHDVQDNDIVPERWVKT